MGDPHPGAGAYPSHLERTFRLRDGRQVTIRPVRHEDAASERSFLNDLSGESRYMRFHKWVGAPGDKLVHFLTDIDYDRHMALVCIAREGESETLVGEARYVVNPDDASCEFGVMIADKWRRSGIAGLLMQALIDAARNRGLTTMEGLVLRSNGKMLRFVRALGFEIRFAPEDPLTVRAVKRLRDAA
jgi:acetyltransferase